MSIFKDIVSIWKSEDLLSQAWDESREMLEFSEDMVSSAKKYLRRGVIIKKLKILKKEDKKFNLKGLLLVILIVNVFLALAAYLIDSIF